MDTYGVEPFDAKVLFIDNNWEGRSHLPPLSRLDDFVALEYTNQILHHWRALVWTRSYPIVLTMANMINLLNGKMSLNLPKTHRF